MTGARPPRDATRFHSIADVAEMCAVSPRSVTRWIKAGELIAHKLGRQWRVADGDLAIFLKLRRMG
jgi:excisionase family DNA binding protein